MLHGFKRANKVMNTESNYQNIFACTTQPHVPVSMADVDATNSVLYKMPLRFIMCNNKFFFFNFNNK